ncbi:MAG: epoxyalkane--coenzyme M transferase [Rhodospirillales bacterium]|nr:epoxyalkane--coenzyme M transferase [Rhodospirillales bacterium]
MKRSTDKILTTHAGSLPIAVQLDKNAADFESALKSEIAGVVARQKELGLDIINEGEYSKGGDWLSFMDGRIGGCEVRDVTDNRAAVFKGREQQEFADFYKYAAERGTLFYLPGDQIKVTRNYWSCTGPVTYTGQSILAKEIALLTEAAGTEDVFLTTTAPASLEPYYTNDFYGTEEEFLFAMADALHTEYKMIADAGLIVQVDDAWLPALWDRIGLEMGLEAFRKRSMLRVEALNQALFGIPEEQIRYHLCWGSWHGPHVYDLEFIHLVDIMLAVNAGAYLIEAANARHEHEWAVWQDTKLPDGKILIPGVITHSTDLVEHPELISQRIQRFAGVVGKENVIGGSDCGFGGRSHPQVAWAKLKALGEGAALAGKALGY